MNDPTKTKAPKGDSDHTERLVLQRVRPGDDLPADVADSEAWVIIGRATGTKAACIDQVAGDAPGQYKAISARSWKGTRVVEVPEQPKPERSWSDD